VQIEFADRAFARSRLVAWSVNIGVQIPVERTQTRSDSPPKTRSDVINIFGALSRFDILTILWSQKFVT
jgi:hypothetical protein